MRMLWMLALLMPCMAGAQDVDDLPRPGDYYGAAMQAVERYATIIAILEIAKTAMEQDDFTAFDDAVRRYRRIMPFLIMWQGRACWRDDPDVPYPMQAVMGESLMSWHTARLQGQETELLRKLLIAGIVEHSRLLEGALADVLQHCTVGRDA